MFAEVILKTSHPDIDRIFDYEIPMELLDKIVLGMRVTVPFGRNNRKTEGYVVGIKEFSQIPKEKIKEIVSVMDLFPAFSESSIKLSLWMKKKYYTTLSQCLQTVMPAGINLKNQEKLLYFNKNQEEIKEIKSQLYLKESRKQQLAVIEYIEKFGNVTAFEAAKKLKISASPIKTLLKNGILKEQTEIKRKEIENYKGETSLPFDFTNEQKNAFDTIINSKVPVLLHGVTGSGKTEVYLQIIEDVISKGKQAIVLVPEISLTPQLSQRFISRFKDRVGVTHSKISQGERHEIWQRAKNNEISIVIGPRSAVFTPFENLGIIIIDEEHENSYKSDITPKYDAREVAEFRCKESNAFMVYGSATPSLKTYKRAQEGEINIAKLKNRPFLQPMAETEIVDMRVELSEGNRTIFSRRLFEEINKTLEADEQIMLFINRRGFSTFVSCRKCGEVMMCDRCNVSYTYHANEKFLMCHYCGGKKEIPTVCPKCGSKYIKYFGTGTQKVEEEVKKFFPKAKVLRMDMDTTSRKNSHANILESFKNGEANVLIGTQMIAKGHDFPKVTLVGVVAADLSLNTSDYKGGENTFQLLTQVSGRAGRGRLKGKVIIQTYSPENYIIQLAAKGNYEEFYEKESAVRKLLNYPPYSNIVSILILGKNERDVIEHINKLSYIFASKNKDFEILGPSPAIISKIKDEYRWSIIIKGENEEELWDFVKGCIDELNKSKKQDILINITLNP